MSANRDEVLKAEAFVREAASELEGLRSRSAALSSANSALDRAVVVLADTAARIESGRAKDREALEQGAVRLQQELSEVDRVRREVYEAALNDAKRSLLDSAQALMQLSSSTAANLEIRSDLAANEREQWRFTLLNSVAEASERLRAAAESFEGFGAASRERAENSLAMLDGSAALLARSATESEAIASRLQRGDAGRTAALGRELRVLKRLVVFSLVIQLLTLVGALLIQFVKGK